MSEITVNYDSIRRVGAVSASADPVERILKDKYGPNITDPKVCQQVKRKTNELLRQLQTRVARGVLGRNDSAESRAAVVMEFVLRTRCVANAPSVPLETLARPLGTSKKIAEEMQQALGHYLSNLEPGCNRRRRAAPGDVGRVGDVSNKYLKSGGATRNTMVTTRAVVSNSFVEPETIRDLSIQLGSLVPDAEGSARRGEALYAALVRHIKQSDNKFNTEAQLSDLSRNKVAYEAACFYFSVNEGEGVRSRPAGKRTGASKASTANAGGEGQSDEEDDRNLSISNVANAARLSEKTFQGIVNEVTKIASEIKAKRLAAQARERKKLERQEQKRQEQKRSKRNNDNVGGGPEKAGRDAPSSSSHEDMLGSLTETNLSSGSVKQKLREGKHEVPSRISVAFTPTATFLEWKEQTLANAIDKAREHANDQELSRHDALEFAVQGIIQGGNALNDE